MSKVTVLSGFQFFTLLVSDYKAEMKGRVLKKIEIQLN
jgi:hypothetical protein